VNLYDAVVARKEKISVVGLGYVGLPLTVAFAKVADVIGFDISREKVEQYHKGTDVTKEVGDKAVQETTAFLTWEEKYLKKGFFNNMVGVNKITSTFNLHDTALILGF